MSKKKPVKVLYKVQVDNVHSPLRPIWMEWGRYATVAEAAGVADEVLKRVELVDVRIQVER